MHKNILLMKFYESSCAYHVGGILVQLIKCYKLHLHWACVQNMFRCCRSYT